MRKGSAAALAGVCALTLPAAATSSATSTAYTLTATKRCLVAKGARVTPVQSIDLRFKALHDLAQRNSFQARSSLGTVGLAFARSSRDAALLAELIRVPRDPYHVVLRRNALLMFRTRSKPAFDAAATCLRGLSKK